MEPDPAHRAPNPGTHLEELKPYGVQVSLTEFGLSKHEAAEKGQELVRKRMQLEPKGIGPIEVTGEPIPRKIQLELLDPILTLPSVVVPRKDLLSPPSTIGDHKADVMTLLGDLDLDHDSSLSGPASGPMPETVEDLNRAVGAGILTAGSLKPALDPLLEDRVGSNPDGIENPEGFQSDVNLWHSRSRIGPVANLAFGEAPLKDGHKTAKLTGDTLRSMGVTRPKTSRKQTARVPLEEKQRVVHVLAILAVEEGKDLLAVAGVVRGVAVQKDLLRDLSFAVAVLKEPLKMEISKPHDALPVGVILQSRERGLGGQGVGFSHNGGEGGIGAKRVRIVTVFIACGDLVDPLAKHLMGMVLNEIRVAPVVKQSPELFGERKLPVKLSQQQQAWIGSDLAAVKIENDFRLKTEPESGMTLCSHRSSFLCAGLMWLSTLSIAQLDGVDGFFIRSTMNNSG